MFWARGGEVHRTEVAARHQGSSKWGRGGELESSTREPDGGPQMFLSQI